ncbi:FtsH protease activity modulator HflK [Pusillimonas caeni]|uniref:FtsH protease activity modulator HflK n=1 Tax=Pusillimonas caeni TaxID=1348472 RepID=UPI000E5A037A|nr:FtsH protease activity modulator HflK [Pusillimonas caeni]TFL10193.1 FtsH protease activity modulator HflK [Pusillimonas caeni]
MRSISKIFNLNDPGWGRGGNNSNDSEPPRRPNQGGGPPDLDEVWRDFNNRLGALFGRKPRRGGSGNGGGAGPGASLPKGSPKTIAVIFIIIVALWLASGFTIVQEGQVAVVTRFGAYTKTLTPGLQWRLPYPIEDSQTVNIAQLRTFEVGFRGNARNKVLSESLMLTTDENIVDVQFVVQYRLNPEGAPDYLFKTSQPDESVRQAVETAMREVVGQQPMDSVLYSGRTEIATRVQRFAQDILDRYQTGIQVSTVAIQNVQPPEQVQAAFDDAVKAGQDRERLINEGNAYASQVLPEAQGQVARMVQQAEGYRARVIGDAQGDTARFASVEGEYAKAPDVTRERMYLTTMQDILENTAKIVVDAGGSNNMLYLPLDKIAGQAARKPAPESGSNSAGSAAAAAAGGAASQGGSTPSSPRGTPYGNGAAGALANPYSR